MIITPGATSQSLTVQIVDDTGLAVTGLVAATFPTTSYERVAEALTGITLSDLAALTSAYSSGGVKEVGGGYYRLDVPDAAFATASKVRIIGEASGKHVLYPVITCAKLAASLGGADYAGNTVQTGDAFARLGAPSGASIAADVLTLLTRLTGTRAGLLDHLDTDVSSRLAAGSYTAPDNADIGTILTAVASIVAKLPANTIADEALVIAATNALASALAALGAPMQAGAHVQLATAQDQYAPAKAGDAMALTSAYDFAKGTVAVAESYSADGAAPTPVQALLVIMQVLTEMGISGTTMTVKKLDGVSTALTLTLNDGTTPTGVTRSG